MTHDPEQEVNYCPGAECSALIRRRRRQGAFPTCSWCRTPLAYVEGEEGNWEWGVDRSRATELPSQEEN